MQYVGFAGLRSSVRSSQWVGLNNVSAKLFNSVTMYDIYSLTTVFNQLSPHDSLVAA
jgi:hypothetical protein